MKSVRFGLFACLLCLLALLVAPATTAAQGGEEAPTVNDVAAELYCPLCAGLTVDVCDLEVCEDMRSVIAEKLEAGESPEQIQAYFVEQYGQRVLGKPSSQGFDITAWVMPFLILGVAGAGLVAWLRRPARPAPSLERSLPAASDGDEYHARLERELQRLEES